MRSSISENLGVPEIGHGRPIHRECWSVRKSRAAVKDRTRAYGVLKWFSLVGVQEWYQEILLDDIPKTPNMYCLSDGPGCGHTKRSPTTSSRTCKPNRLWNDTFYPTNEFVAYNDANCVNVRIHSDWFKSCIGNKRINFSWTRATRHDGLLQAHSKYNIMYKFLINFINCICKGACDNVGKRFWRQTNFALRQCFSASRSPLRTDILMAMVSPDGIVSALSK